MPEIARAVISALGGAVCQLLDCVPVTARRGRCKPVRIPTLHLCNLTYPTLSEAADLCAVHIRTISLCDS